MSNQHQQFSMLQNILNLENSIDKIAIQKNSLQEIEKKLQYIFDSSVRIFLESIFAANTWRLEILTEEMDGIIFEYYLLKSVDKFNISGLNIKNVQKEFYYHIDDNDSFVVRLEDHIMIYRIERHLDWFKKTYKVE